MVVFWIISLLVTFSSIMLLIPWGEGERDEYAGVKIILLVFQMVVLATLIWMGVQIWFTN